MEARIFGTLQDWDLQDNRYDIERVNIPVPPEALVAYMGELESMMNDGWHGNDETPLGNLVMQGIEDGWFKPCSRWEPEDPCELRLATKWHGSLIEERKLGKSLSYPRDHDVYATLTASIWECAFKGYANDGHDGDIKYEWNIKLLPPVWNGAFTVQLWGSAWSEAEARRQMEAAIKEYFETNGKAEGHRR